MIEVLVCLLWGLFLMKKFFPAIKSCSWVLHPACHSTHWQLYTVSPLILNIHTKTIWIRITMGQKNNMHIKSFSNSCHELCDNSGTGDSQLPLHYLPSVQLSACSLSLMVSNHFCLFQAILTTITFRICPVCKFLTFYTVSAERLSRLGICLCSVHKAPEY